MGVFRCLSRATGSGGVPRSLGGIGYDLIRLSYLMYRLVVPWRGISKDLPEKHMVGVG